MSKQSHLRVRRTSVVDEVFQLIQARIHSGELSLGYNFPPQKILAKEMGVSTSTVREAFNKLIMLGYLSTKPGVGTTVVSRSTGAPVSNLGSYVFLQSSEIGHFIEARLYLEKAAIRSAVRNATDEDFNTMEKYIEGQKQALRDGDVNLFATLDAEFHLSVVAAGRNPVLIRFMELIWDMLYSYIVEANQIQSVMNAVALHHEDILRKLKLRDVPGAEQKMIEHLQEVVKKIELHLGYDIGLGQLLYTEL